MALKYAQWWTVGSAYVHRLTRKQNPDWKNKKKKDVIMKPIITIVLSLFSTVAFSATNPVVFDFEVYGFSALVPSQGVYGQIKGIDANDDNILTTDELLSITTNIVGVFNPPGETTLYSFNPLSFLFEMNIGDSGIIGDEANEKFGFAMAQSGKTTWLINLKSCNPYCVEVVDSYSDGPGSSANVYETLSPITFTKVTPVPVPATIWLLGSALAGLAGASVQKRGGRRQS